MITTHPRRLPGDQVEPRLEQHVARRHLRRARRVLRPRSAAHGCDGAGQLGGRVRLRLHSLRRPCPGDPRLALDRGRHRVSRARRRSTPRPHVSPEDHRDVVRRRPADCTRRRSAGPRGRADRAAAPHRRSARRRRRPDIELSEPVCGPAVSPPGDSRRPRGGAARTRHERQPGADARPANRRRVPPLHRFPNGRAIRTAYFAGRHHGHVLLHAWRYRDYVIDAFTNDKPYNQFIREQIAGDLLPANSPGEKAEQLIATGFLALGVKDVNQRFKVRFTMDNIDEQIDTVSRSILALTASCSLPRSQVRSDSDRGLLRAGRHLPQHAIVCGCPQQDGRRRL